MKTERIIQIAVEGIYELLREDDEHFYYESSCETEQEYKEALQFFENWLQKLNK